MCILVLFIIACGTVFINSGHCADDDGPYKGKYIGKLNSYHHQVSGEVYAVDDFTLLLTSFSYDGNGADTFFWAGAANRPGPQGFIVPDEYGKTNVLDRYFNKDFTLTLPDNKKITDIKWFAIYDLWSQNTFGDIYIPEEFEPPNKQKIGQISARISVGDVIILDAKRLQLVDFTYFGGARRPQFWVGVGPQPVSKGFKVPDDHGYLDPIRTYNSETVELELPGDLTIFNIDWFSVFDLETAQSLGSIIIPDGLNVPPSLVKIVVHKNDLPNCVQLHKKLQVSWEIFGPQITIQLAGQIDEDSYMSFGISGSTDRSTMLGADVAVAYMDGYRGYATDYNITALTPCVKVLGQSKGVCKDDVVGGQDNNQIHTAIRENGVSIITYRRFLISPDHGDKEFPSEGSTFIVWAIGRLDENKEPSFHDFYPKTNISLHLGGVDPTQSTHCFAFTHLSEVVSSSQITAWPPAQIFDRSIRAFHAYLGPSGGRKAYTAITQHTSTALSWYVNGYLAPELWLRRGLTYAFKVNGGNNPHSAEYYHPLIITDEPHGGFDRLTDAAQARVRVLAGVEYSRRGRPRPAVAGALCIARHRPNVDRRLDDDFLTFKKFNRSLQYECDSGDAAILEFTPNTSWPDTVYYNSFTQANMGWKIHVIDSFRNRNSGHSIGKSAHYYYIIMIIIYGIYLFH